MIARALMVAASVLLAPQQSRVPQPVPAELAASIGAARLDGTIAGWCRGGFRQGGGREYAVALSRESGGSYVVVDARGAAVTLASFHDGAELSCYTPAEARQINGTIAKSETISGRVTPRWKTTVICGFVENTSAVCWQYSPSSRTFVKIGGWTT